MLIDTRSMHLLTRLSGCCCRIFLTQELPKRLRRIRRLYTRTSRQLQSNSIHSNDFGLEQGLIVFNFNLENSCCYRIKINPETDLARDRFAREFRRIGTIIENHARRGSKNFFKSTSPLFSLIIFNYHMPRRDGSLGKARRAASANETRITLASRAVGNDSEIGKRRPSRGPDKSFARVYTYIYTYIYEPTAC